MENSGESGEDSGSLGTAAFLAGNNISSGYIIHSDDMEDDPENTDDSNHASDHLHGGHSGGGGTLREQDRFLPIANVAKIMKRAIPDAGKIAKDARECVQECVSEFISFITSEASDRCHMEKRKTINGEDILFAMTTLGFDNYVEPLKLYLQKYREATKGDNPVPPINLLPAGGEDGSGGGATAAVVQAIKTDQSQQSVTYDDQIFTIASAGDAATSDAPIIYSYTTGDGITQQFHLHQ
ncbi:nuclear transcription factor Y subunit B-3 [Trichogramma pretiosum]|uniref:nuclear transcription factor Y subunit B-3 n=1 Tax=Trichogramma pretiosum TaxID=7493 RepID=UPI0006C97971|nr:nuclear transcription factor Y subunit B-3 [Trichogramma pretiosum]